MSISVNDEYREEKECVYKGRRYIVRDNGAVMRLSDSTGRKTKNDDVWTFGTKDTAGYPAIGGVRVHLIVAAAYLGEKADPTLVVDHKDTIKVNNRPSNLHYVTRFGNLVNNPLTRMKLEHAVGLPIEKILENLEVLHNLRLPPNLTWVKSVSQAEADAMRMKMEYITSRPVDFSRGMRSVTDYAIQTDGWFPKGEFPCCPQHDNSSLKEYADNLSVGCTVFHHQYRDYTVVDFGVSEDAKTLAIKCMDSQSVKQNILITVNYSDKKWFIHKCDRYFSEEGLEKYYTIALGHEWTGGNVIDDYC